jgi:hypothetical protein
MHAGFAFYVPESHAHIVRQVCEHRTRQRYRVYPAG